MKWTINHLEDLNKVAAEFLDYDGDKTIFALYGPMGVGKTTFVKAVAACLGVTDDVSSPTFALVNEYQTKNGKSLYHFDFYRVIQIAEALRLASCFFGRWLSCSSFSGCLYDGKSRGNDCTRRQSD